VRGGRWGGGSVGWWGGVDRGLRWWCGMHQEEATRRSLLPRATRVSGAACVAVQRIVSYTQLAGCVWRWMSRLADRACCPMCHEYTAAKGSMCAALMPIKALMALHCTASEWHQQQLPMHNSKLWWQCAMRSAGMACWQVCWRGRYMGRSQRMVCCAAVCRRPPVAAWRSPLLCTG
jgi:hypothetical protein